MIESAPLISWSLSMKRCSIAAFLYTVCSLVAIKAFHSRDTREVEYNECNGRFDIVFKAISAGNWCNIKNEGKEQSNELVVDYLYARAKRLPR